ncbi:MAG: leucine-rich repeat protein [Lachnospiraceae bacterium]|nr:leucine-rich repeat protein [Lachnospiraceae bacterium]
MKKYVRKIELFVLILALVMPSVYFGDAVEAYGDIKDGWIYEVISREDGETVEIIGYTGEDKDIVIPDSIEGVKVTSIRMIVFFGESITIPESVTNIDQGAFEACKGLENITVDKDNKVYDSRDNCNAIIETLTNTLISACQNTTIPESVTSIGDYAFSGCTGLKSITIPESVTSIGWGAFNSCTGLESITIPESMTNIGDFAFYLCSGLKSITIPESVISIGQCAFEDCRGLENITVDKDNKVYDSRDNCNAIIETLTNTLISASQNTTIPESVTSIGDYAFSGFTGLESITIPESVTSIGRGAFNSCTGLKSITIPESMTSIGEGAFYGCTGLKSITIPKSMTSIGEGAFEDCTGLKSITIPESVTSIGDYAFYGCTGLKSITIPESVTSIGRYAFGYCRGSYFEHVKLADFVICGTSDSEAERYANDNGFTFRLSSMEQPTVQKLQTIKVTKSYTKTYGAKPFKLNAKLTKGNGSLTYASSNKKTASVDRKGRVTIKGTGICTITVKAAGTDTYKSTSAKITITVKPKKNKVVKLKSSESKTLKVTWEKDTKCAGYELQYSSSKKFTKSKTINISKNKTTSYKIWKLSKGKKYYVRVRAYQNVKVNGKTKKLYGDWSTAKQSGKVN